MTPDLREAFEHQGVACAALGSPFMERWCNTVLDCIDPDSKLAARLLNWDVGRLRGTHDAVALRLAGGMHLLRLQGDAVLDAVYPPHQVDDIPFRAGLTAALALHDTVLTAALDQPPQTNEVRRAAVIIAAGHWLTARTGKMLVTSEVGASAGLNLNWDFFCLHAGDTVLGPGDSPVILSPEWRGTPAHACPAYVAEARGVDIATIDPGDPREALRLQSYLWPDQQDRLDRTRAAVGLFNAPDTEGRVDEGDALAWLPERLAPRPGHCRMIYSTIAWQYLGDRRTEGEAMIAAAGAQATANSPLAWFTMEPDGQSPGAKLTMHLWPGDEPAQILDFGRVDFHGRWVDWQAPDPA
ncbi:MAG: DUF2332 family protein [Pseudomonadota bacterium]